MQVPILPALFFVSVLVSSLSFSMERKKSLEAIFSDISSALETQSYSGRFNFERQGLLKTFEITHSHNQIESKTLLRHVSGDLRHYSYDAKLSPCDNNQAFGGYRRTARGVQLKYLDDNYFLYSARKGRIADRVATIIKVVPRDRWRYGTTLAIDNISKLPLLVTTNDVHGNMLERFQFVSIDVYKEMPDSVIRYKRGQSNNEQSEHVTVHSYDDCEAKNNNVPSHYKPRWVPRGFVLNKSRYDDKIGYTLGFSDGLASFSLFIKNTGSEPKKVDGFTQNGATSIVVFSTSIDSVPIEVILIGEIPPIAAKKIASSVAKR